MTVDRRLADVTVGVGLAVITIMGAYGTLVAYRRVNAAERMMDGAMGGMVTGPFWYAMSTVVVAAIVGGLYLFTREKITRPPDVNGAVSMETDGTTASASGTGVTRPDPLEVLPEDERRILEPVLESPGITQVALRDRSEFSKSKVSQTVSALEKRGILYRERQGRTYRVYPDDSLRNGT